MPARLTGQEERFYSFGRVVNNKNSSPERLLFEVDELCAHRHGRLPARPDER